MAVGFIWRSSWRLLAVVLVCFALFQGAAERADAQSGRKVALVIGNGAYVNAPPLANPRNDANDIATELRRLGFEVTLGLDLDKRGMEETLARFSRALPGAEVALFYYAGHAMQAEGKNHMAPIDVRLTDAYSLDFETVTLDQVMRPLEREPRVSLIFLDACRDNPLARSLARSLGGATRSSAPSSGLARVAGASVGALIAFATEPGAVAADGRGRNSPFTAAMLRQLRENPNQEITRLMRNVRQDVYQATGGAQVPWVNEALLGDVFLGGGGGGGGGGVAAAPAPAPTPAPAPAPAPSADTAYVAPAQPAPGGGLGRQVALGPDLPRGLSDALRGCLAAKGALAPGAGHRLEAREITRDDMDFSSSFRIKLVIEYRVVDPATGALAASERISTSHVESGCQRRQTHCARFAWAEAYRANAQRFCERFASGG